MNALLQAFLWLLANAASSTLARQVLYLKGENRILRSKLPGKITVSPEERQTLLRYGGPVGAALKELISIVTPRTFLRWLHDEKKPNKAQRPSKPRRPRTAEEVRDLIVRLARENEWGYTRILGELRKLGVGNVSRSTVVNILRENGLDPGPKRGKGTWDEFLKRHAQTLWACDFFSVKVWTLGGLVDLFVLFFLHVGSRRVYITGVTAQPDGVWVAQQARNLALIFEGQEHKPAYLLRDYDTKFTGQFDEILEAEGLEVKAVGPRAPTMNAYAERFVQSVKEECLGQFVFLGEAHLRHVLKEYVDYYNQLRPHQGVGNVPLGGSDVPEQTRGLRSGDVVCEERLGGLLKHYRRAA